MQIANGVQGILRPGQGRMMQEWDLKRRGLEDAARIEALNNNARMRQYAADSQAPMNAAREEMYRKHGNFYDTLGAARMLGVLTPKQTAERPATNREALVARDLQDRLNSADPKIRTAAQQELDTWKKQQEQRLVPAADRSAVIAYKQPYISKGFDDTTATILAVQDLMAERGNIQAQKTKESESRVEGNQARSKRDISIANRNNRTPIGSGNDSAKADAEVKRKGEALAKSLRDQADNDPAEALAILAEMGSRIPEPIRVHAKAVLMDRRDKKSKDDDDIIGAFNDAVEGTKSSTSKPVGKATTTAAPTTSATAPKSTKPSKELVYQGGKFVPAKPAAK